MVVPESGGELSAALVNAVLLALWVALPGLVLGYIRQVLAARKIRPEFALRKSEIAELDRKLCESHPTVRLPVFLIDVQSLPSPPLKRKSTFLNTLSRLASPTSSKIARGSSSRRFTNASTMSSGPTPLTSPSGEHRQSQPP